MLQVNVAQIRIVRGIDQLVPQPESLYQPEIPVLVWTSPVQLEDRQGCFAGCRVRAAVEANALQATKSNSKNQSTMPRTLTNIRLIPDAMKNWYWRLTAYIIRLDISYDYESIDEPSPDIRHCVRVGLTGHVVWARDSCQCLWGCKSCFDEIWRDLHLT